MKNVVKWFTTTKTGRIVGIFLLGGTIAVAAHLGLPGTEYLQQALDFLKVAAVAA